MYLCEGENSSSEENFAFPLENFNILDSVLFIADLEEILRYEHSSKAGKNTGSWAVHAA